jgi:NO-binding membrane sensor protein with MHYT domain
VKELLQGRRLGFAPRSHLAFLACGLAVGVTLADLMSWLGLGTRDTNGYVIFAQWLCVATILVAGLAAIAAVTERFDVVEEERGLAQLDILAGVAVVALYGVSAVLRSLELGNPAPSPVPFLLAIAGLITVFVDAGLAANMYSSREWEELEEEPIREHRRRRVSR